ncbi:MAG: flavodoxin family protein [Armatimonadota bacterium]
MKNIFAFIGSPLKEKSNTFTLTKMMLDRILEIDNNVNIDAYTAGSLKLEFCRGCWQCMTRGFCPQDANDNMGPLKEKMLEADFIILGSPVYTVSVSGQTKTFFDRLCSWYHMIRLAGKPGMSVVTTAHDAAGEVHEFMTMLMSALGIYSVARLSAFAYFPGVYADQQKAKDDAVKTAEIIYPYISGEKKAESNQYMEEAFAVMKKKVLYGKKYLGADYEYWEKNGMLDINSYGELLEKKRK